MKLRIEKAVYGGAGLARIPEDPSSRGAEAPTLAGKTIFTPYALPGELVEAHITENRRGFSIAGLDSVLEPSPERVLPGCEYFLACGGCHYQHASANYQLQMKLDILRDTLDRARLSSRLSQQTIGSLSGEPWAYRNRIRLRVASQDGSLTLCYRERASHRNLPVAHCPIAAPILERAITAALSIGQESGLADLCDEIEFFTNGEEEALLLSLWTPAGANRPDHSGGRSREQALGQRLEEFCRRLQAQIPELTGAGLFSAGDRGDRALAHWGQGSLLYTVAEQRYRVSLGSFFQVNRFLLPQLLTLVAGNRSGGSAWDLYAGVGLFTLALDFEHVTAVEDAPSSAADLKQNLAGTLHRAVRSTALDFLRSQSRGGARAAPDLILLDPPRAGLGKEVCAHLAQVAAPEIVYVSCDPATLVRDLQALLQSGYRLENMHLVDLFPQTFHLETVTVLVRDGFRAPART